MLAKPEYSSPPDEVCCWAGRRGGAAGRECHGEEDGGTVADSHREAFAGRGTVAERLQRGGAMAEHLLAGAPWRKTIGMLLPARVPWQSCWSGVPWRRGWRHCGREPSGSFCWPGRCSGAPSGSSHCRKGKKSHCRKGRKSHCWKGKERSATAGKKGLQGATGWSLFLMRPLCKLFLYL